jgi:glycosyltransferase involved in cell wall biosynthesis
MEDFYPVMHGATRQTMLIGEQFVKRDIDVIVITRRISKNHSKQEEINGIRVYRVPPVVMMSRYGKYLMLLPAFWTLIKKSKEYDVILVSDFKVLGIIGVISSKLLGKKCILRGASCGEMDGSYAFALDNSPSFIKRFFVKVLVSGRNTIIKYSDIFLSISSPITNELKNCGIVDKKIFEMNNGVDTAIFKPVSISEKENLRVRLKLPNSFIFIYSGRLAKGKGLFTLLNAWGKVLQSYNDIHLLFVGSGQGFALGCEDELKRIVKSKNIEKKVIFTGHVENVYEYLQASDCFVFPTEYEALGNCLLEATSCGLPCIATRTGGIVDIINHDENGLLFEVNDEDGLLDVLRIILDDKNKRKILATQARKTALKKFNIDNKINILESLVFSLLKK